MVIEAMATTIKMAYCSSFDMAFDCYPERLDMI
jgi:hypothetical protein